MATVKIAGLVDVTPPMLVNTARTCHPETHNGAGALVHEPAVAPVMLVQVVPLSTDSCHWTVGAGGPREAAENVAV